MRTPATYLADNLMFTRSGVIWATWRLRPLWYKYAPTEKQKLARLHHQALWQSLRGEVLLFGLCADIEPAAVVSQMVDGIDLRTNELWLENAERALADLEQIGVGERTFWLAVPLSGGGLGGAGVDLAFSATSALREGLGLPATIPSQAHIERAKAQAKRVAESIPAAFDPVPATAAQQLWINLHSQLRGLRVEGSPPPATESEDRGWQSAGFIQPHLDEAGQSEATKTTERIAVHRRRYVGVASPLSDDVSYQSLLALASTPKQGWTVPGGEWMQRLDEFEFDIDWCQRVRISSADVAKRRNKTAEDKLKDQLFQQDDDNQDAVGGNMATLRNLHDDLRDYQRALDANEREVEIRATTIVAVSGRTPEEVRVKRDALRADGASMEFIWDPSLGSQRALWWAMQPGVPATGVVGEYEQLTTGSSFGTSVPITSSAIGHTRGSLLAWNRTTGRGSPVMFDPGEDLSANRSGSFGITGELGSGKSGLLKTIAANALARSDRVLILDPTPRREYTPVVRVLDPNAVIVDPVEPTYSLDPLRIFPPAQAARVTQTLFATMLGVGPLEDRGALLAELIDPVYLQRHEIGSLASLREHLAASDDPELRALLRVMNLVATKDIGAVLFDSSLPPLPLDARAIVVSTSELAMPSQAELDDASRFSKMPVEKVFGNAIYGLMAGIAEALCFADHSDLAYFLVDEASRMSAPQGQAILERFVMDGRKHAAVLGVAGQTVAQLGNEQLRGLVPTRFAFRQSDEHLAAEAASWVGLGPDGAAHLQALSPAGHEGQTPEHRRAEAIMRDARGRIAKVKIQLPFVPTLREAISTTPELRRNRA